MDLDFVSYSGYLTDKPSERVAYIVECCELEIADAKQHIAAANERLAKLRIKTAKEGGWTQLQEVIDELHFIKSNEERIVNAEARSVKKGKQAIGNLDLILGDNMIKDTSVRLQVLV